MSIKSSKLSDEFFWKENFESFEELEALKYHKGVTTYPFNIKLYDKLLIELISKILPSGQLKILDAGGGTGKWTEYFAKMGHHVTLLDISQSMLTVAKKNLEERKGEYEADIICGDICNMPFQKNSFDFILCDRNPISHCGNKERSHKSISELYRVLKPGGVILGSVLNKYRKVCQMIMELEIEKATKLYQSSALKRGEDTYTYYYTSVELKQILEQTGFFEVEIIPTTVFTEFISTAWVLSDVALNPLLKLEKEIRTNKDLIDYGVRYHFIGKK